MDENTFNELQISYLEMRGIAEPREARGGREKKCSKMCNRGGGAGAGLNTSFNIGSWNVRCTQSPFGYSKFKPSALAWKRIWDLNGVAVVKEG